MSEREGKRGREGQTYFVNIKFPDGLQTAVTFPYCQYQACTTWLHVFSSLYTMP